MIQRYYFTANAHTIPLNFAYGLETMTFDVGPLDAVRLVDFEHQDEPD